MPTPIYWKCQMFVFALSAVLCSNKIYQVDVLFILIGSIFIQKMLISIHV